MRSKPKFGKQRIPKSRSGSNNSPSCILFLVVAVVGYFVIKAFSRVTAGYGNDTDYLICFGVVALLVGIYYLENQDKEKETDRYLDEQRRWRRRAKVAEVAIVSRRHSPGGANDDGYNIHYSRAFWHLTLEKNADQLAVSPNKIKNISIKVNQNVYASLVNRDTVRIYYHRDDPLTFLLEGEFR